MATMQVVASVTSTVPEPIVAPAVSRPSGSYVTLPSDAASIAPPPDPPTNSAFVVPLAAPAA